MIYEFEINRPANVIINSKLSSLKTRCKTCPSNPQTCRQRNKKRNKITVGT